MTLLELSDITYLENFKFSKTFILGTSDNFKNHIKILFFQLGHKMHLHTPIQFKDTVFL